MLIPNALLVFTFLSGALASSGDRNPEFNACVDRCQAESCQPLQADTLPIGLRLTRWTCSDDCKYNCMHYITDRAVEPGKPMEQYYGKWPFWRLGGIQEPASVAFSLLNLWAHARGGAKIRRRISQDHPMRSYYLTWSMVSINAWIWSSVFHTRDLPATEKLDYFAAALAIMYALYYTSLRVFHLYPVPQLSRLTLSSKTSGSWIRNALATVCIMAYLGHVSYLTLLPRFDYAYNMAFNVGVGLAHNFLWIAYSLPASWSILRRFPGRPKSYRPGFVNQAALFVLLTTLAIALELFDFPPWGRIIDAHSLWHLATVPIAFLWYDFLLADSLDPSWREQRLS
ncbi:Per1-like protein [Agrocybe pediades]|nr:Per1-like protein [Agrocybe pediades]